MQIDITSLDVEVTFWQLYPEFKAVEPFASWYAGDKSKNKENSSKKCWFIALGYHPTSTLSKMEKEEKHKLLSVSYLKDPAYFQKNKNDLEEAIPVFLTCTTTPTMRQILKLEELLDKRGKFLEEQEYDLGTFEDLDKMFAATDKIQATFDKLKTKLAAEEDATMARGSKNLSASDMNLG